MALERAGDLVVCLVNPLPRTKSGSAATQVNVHSVAN